MAKRLKARPSAVTDSYDAASISSETARSSSLDNRSTTSLTSSASSTRSRGRPRKSPVAASGAQEYRSKLGYLKHSPLFYPASLALVALFLGLLLSAFYAATPRLTASPTVNESPSGSVPRPSPNPAAPPSPQAIAPLSPPNRPSQAFAKAGADDDQLGTERIKLDELLRDARVEIKSNGGQNVAEDGKRLSEAEREEEDDAVSVEERLKHSFRFTDLEGDDAVNDLPSIEVMMAEMMAEIKGFGFDDGGVDDGEKKPRTLKELQEAMEGFDADELTLMLNQAYGRD